MYTLLLDLPVSRDSALAMLLELLSEGVISFGEVLEICIAIGVCVSA